VNRKSIATNMAIVSCDVCGRTLLRGENADVFLHGGSRRTVCELCTSRARHEGWIREGVDGVMPGRLNERGGAARSLLYRLRHRRETPGGETERAYTPPPAPAVERVQDDGYYDAPADEVQATVEPAMPEVIMPEVVMPEVVMPTPVPAPAPLPAAAPVVETQAVPRESRSVHAIPTNEELKVARALEVFNASSHPRTVAGVARSLGTPIVAARPSTTEGAIVTIVVGWELSWYRYEVDLGDEASGVRVSGQGAELSELDPADQASNATADERGELHPVAGVT